MSKQQIKAQTSLLYKIAKKSKFYCEKPITKNPPFNLFKTNQPKITQNQVRQKNEWFAYTKLLKRTTSAVYTNAAR